MSYQNFLAAKQRLHAARPIEHGELGDYLRPFQRHVVSWALAKGRCAIFADTGLGKTVMQLEWARHVPGAVLILTPLAVAEQTIREGARFGIKVQWADASASPDSGIWITNYDRAERFDPSRYTAVVLDESSILKHHDAKTRAALTEAWSRAQYRLCCTATPSPNDYTELGNHAEFLGVCSQPEMLAEFFVHDGGSTQDWRLKGHARTAFWRWVSGWAMAFRSPAQVGFPADHHDLPSLSFVSHTIETEATEGELFAMPAEGLAELRTARKQSLVDRVRSVADVVNAEPAEPWIVWCHTNDESDLLVESIADAVGLYGSEHPDIKRDKLIAFSEKRIRVLVTKPSIAGFGMNWQHCARQAWVGLSYSYESFYQAVRRCWRYGQERPVVIHYVGTDKDAGVIAALQRKAKDFDSMADEMAQVMGTEHIQAKRTIEQRTERGENWTMLRGDCVERIAEIERESVGYSIFSPPFASLYTYSQAEQDMGNCKDHDEFFEHFAFLLPELYRVLMPGRVLSFHCMNLPTSKFRDGVIGISDFRGELIRAFEKVGFIFHSEVVIWKDPVTAMQRTKALGLLHKQLKKDAAMSRQGIPDYLVTMRKPGANPKPIQNTDNSFPVEAWQRYASPVWMDINPSDTLQYMSAREHDDEKHICPLQLGVIRRAVYLWSGVGDLVLSPFAGIGSEGYVSVEMARRFVGIELKESYFKQAVANLRAANSQTVLGLPV